MKKNPSAYWKNLSEFLAVSFFNVFDAFGYDAFSLKIVSFDFHRKCQCVHKTGFN